jgi:hypothetical protein
MYGGRAEWMWQMEQEAFVCTSTRLSSTVPTTTAMLSINALQYEAFA